MAVRPIHLRITILDAPGIACSAVEHQHAARPFEGGVERDGRTAPARKDGGELSRFFVESCSCRGKSERLCRGHFKGKLGEGGRIVGERFGQDELTALHQVIVGGALTRQVFPRPELHAVALQRKRKAVPIGYGSIFGIAVGIVASRLAAQAYGIDPLNRQFRKIGYRARVPIARHLSSGAQQLFCAIPRHLYGDERFRGRQYALHREGSVVRHAGFVDKGALLHAHLHVGCRDIFGKLDRARNVYGICIIIEPDPVDPIAFLLRELPRIGLRSIRALLVGIDGGSGIAGCIHVAFVVDIVMG